MRKSIHRVVICLAAALLFAWLAPGAAGAGGSLDGKTFSGTLTKKGKAKGNKDTFTFKDGKFRSTACDTYGFGDAAYMATAGGGGTAFEATTTSPKEGTMKWKGTVQGDAIEGTAVWVKAGQKDADYTFKGTLKK